MSECQIPVLVHIAQVISLVISMILDMILSAYGANIQFYFAETVPYSVTQM